MKIKIVQDILLKTSDFLLCIYMYHTGLSWRSVLHVDTEEATLYLVFNMYFFHNIPTNHNQELHYSLK